MKKYELYRETLLPVNIDEAWQFFSNPYNLAEITPKEMDFKVVTKELPSEIHSGLTILYTVKPLANVPLKWLSKIREVEAPYRFVDEQLKGPYAYWYHEHTFEEKEGLTVMKDKITYAVPMGWLGQLANTLLVRRKLEQIFDYRSQKILKLFKGIG
ncbi:SRPBCC family protein [Pedobacter sp. ASV28]|jgi:ligand-binding SRPBCC domain-containing protein|uniref:SRPBCC family protein n=1 Tax=Pedobacter sp. ASV28 TaxID=2795123 RepID=UPI0018EB6F1B|nr:SRPBCC family protein [Pedobacter sp. ASV28]